MGVTGTEAIAASAISLLAAIVTVAYGLDLVGLPISPTVVLVLSSLAAAITFRLLRSQSKRRADELDQPATLAAIVFGVAGWLVWLSRPDFVPLGTGADLTHHLQLVDYIERNWRLVHDPSVEASLGEMIHYTPGVHLLAALVGTWTGTDGFRALHPIAALSAGLKAGFVFLIARRMLPDRLPRTPLATMSALILLLPTTYFLASFTRYSYFAQVTAELFAVAAWWALVVWDAQPSRGAMVLFAIAGCAAFLTWPVWIGPIVLVQAAAVTSRKELVLARRLEHLLIGAAPIVLIAAIHAAGRLAWIGIVRADADVRSPTWNDFGWVFAVFALAGIIAATYQRRGRITAALVAALALQAAALYAAAKANGAVIPYMAIKMTYLVIYPLAACAALAIGTLWLAASAATPGAILQGRSGAAVAWLLVAAAGASAFGNGAARLEVKPIVSEDLYNAGRWARVHLDAACIDYLVADELTAYWLHLAVLGNPRMSARTADDGTFRPRDGVIRWIGPRGLPFAIADLTTLPRDVRSQVDEIARFGSAAVVKRRGGASCP